METNTTKKYPILVKKLDKNDINDVRIKLSCLVCNNEYEVDYKIKYYNSLINNISLKRKYCDKCKIEKAKERGRIANIESKNKNIEKLKKYCWFCKSDKWLVIHHYNNKPNSIIALCGSCHRKIHDLDNLKNSEA